MRFRFRFRFRFRQGFPVMALFGAVGPIVVFAIGFYLLGAETRRKTKNGLSIRPPLLLSLSCACLGESSFFIQGKLNTTHTKKDTEKSPRAVFSLRCRLSGPQGSTSRRTHPSGSSRPVRKSPFLNCRHLN